MPPLPPVLRHGRAAFAPTARAIDRGAFQSILSALPAEAVATGLLNSYLAQLRLRLAWDTMSQTWRIRVSQGAEASSDADAALLGLAQLVEADGWQRVKRCQLVGCTKPFLDLTNGATRKYCDRHRTCRS